MMGFSHNQVAALRISITMLVLLPFAFIHFHKIPKSKLKYVVLSGFLGSGIPAFLFTAAQTRLDSSMAGVLNTLTPVWALFIAMFFFKMKAKAMQIMGIVIGFVGAVSLIIFHKGGVDNKNLPYASLIVVATFMYGMNLNLLRNYLKEIHPLHLASVAFVIIGILSTAYLLTTDFLARINHEPAARQAIIYVIILAVAGTGLASIVFYYLAQRTSTLFAAITTYFIPVVAVGWGALIGESVGIMHLLGLALILLGVFMVTKN